MQGETPGAVATAPRGSSARFRPVALAPSAQAVDELAQAFARDPEAAFGARVPPSVDVLALARLRALLADPDELVRWGAVRVLAIAPRTPDVDALLALATRDAEPLVQKEAALALEERGLLSG